MIPYSSEYCLCFRVILGNTTALSTLSKNVEQKGFLGASLVIYDKHERGHISTTNCMGSTELPCCRHQSTEFKWFGYMFLLVTWSTLCTNADEFPKAIH